MAEAEADENRPSSSANEHGWELCRGGGVVRYGAEGVLVSAPPYFYLARRRYLRRYDPRSDAWELYETATRLPAPIGRGASMAYDGWRYLYVTVGDDSGTFCRFNVGARGLRKLASAPAQIGAGGRLAHGENYLYALRGGETNDFWRYDTNAGRWRKLAPLPDSSSPPIGYVSSGLVYADGMLYACPDHRIIWYDAVAEEWHHFATLGFRPACDGGMHALDEDTKRLYVIQGMGSRTLGVLDLQRRQFRHLRPRLPDVVSVEGNRAVVAEVEGMRYLYVYRGHDTDEFWRIRLDALLEVGESG